MAQQILSTNTFTTAKWIVSATASDGTHTTIAAALTSASSGDTIFIRPGTYTENITLKAGVNLTAFGSDSSLNGTGVVIINGTCTMTTAGTVTISGIQLKTNAAVFLAVTGSAASVVSLNNCYLNYTNNTGITYSSSSASSSIILNNCSGNISTTGIALYTSSSAGGIGFINCFITNTGLSTTQSSNSAGSAAFVNTTILSPVSTSGTGLLSATTSTINTAGINVIAITTAGTGTNNGVLNSVIASGSAACLSVGVNTAAAIYDNNFSSTATFVLTGAGTINYAGNTYAAGISSGNNVTIQQGGTIQGSVFQTPSAGFLGEQFRAFATVAATSSATGNVTSTTLTPGVWDISCTVESLPTVSVTALSICINTTSASFAGTITGDNLLQLGHTGTVTSLSIPSYRVVITASTTYYLVYSTTFSGTCNVSGRISATRVG